LDHLEARAAVYLGDDRRFLAEHAWQELEVWALAGHDLVASGRPLEVRDGTTMSWRTESITVTKSDSTSPKCWKTDRTETSARLATATTVGAVLVSAIIAVAAEITFRRVSTARLLRPSGRTVFSKPATALARGITAASLIFRYPNWGSGKRWSMPRPSPIEGMA
jgi:hypothetical protein